MDIQGKEFFFQLMDRLVQWQKHENYEPLELLSIHVIVDYKGGNEWFSKILIEGLISNSDRDIENALNSKHPNDQGFFEDMTDWFEFGRSPSADCAAFYQSCCEIPKEVNISDAMKELQQECNIKYPDAEIDFFIPTQSAGGCYIATAVYGSYDCPQVWTLRRYRDERLRKSFAGRAFVRLYYTVSPTLVKWFGETKWFNRFWRVRLDRIVDNLQKRGYEKTPYED